MPSFIESKEIIIVDDKSGDGSFETVSEYASLQEGIKIVRHERNMGKGAAVRTGAGIAAGDVLLIQDADMELNPFDIPAVLTLMRSNNLSVAGGSRFMGHNDRNNLPTYLANKLFSGLASIFLRKKITDLTCGYKAIRKDLFFGLELHENRFGFETELMMKALHNTDNTFKEVPVSYKPRTKSAGKKIRVIDGFSIMAKIIHLGMAGKRWISSFAAILAVFIVLHAILQDKRWKNPDCVIEWDVISYYDYLPAAFIYHDMDLSFKDSYNGPNRILFWPQTAPTGKYVIKTTMGLSFLYLPFFALGHAMALITGVDAGGFSEPYRFALMMSSIFFLALGLYYLRKLLLTFYSDIVTAVVIAGFVFGTNLFWYSTYQATMPHVYSFCLIAMFLWYTVRWYQKPSVANSVISGFLLGLISLIRPTNAIIILVFLFFDTYNFKTIKERVGYLWDHSRNILLMAAVALLVWVPQMVYWKAMTDHFLFFSYTDNERFFFNNPQILNGLLSFRKGLLIYTPILVLAFAGIWYLWRSKSPFALSFSVFLPINIYIIFSWWCWWYGGSFGSRPFIDCYALMAVSVASVLQGCFKTKRYSVRTVLATFYVLIVSLGIYYHKQYYYGSIHWDSMTKEAFIDSFGRLRPSPEFHSLLHQPDYEKAKAGIEE